MQPFVFNYMTILHTESNPNFERNGY